MKYIITDKNEVRVGSNTFHQILSEGCEGKVVSAGHCEKGENGKYRVWGSSIGYGIDSKPEDALLLDKFA